MSIRPGKSLTERTYQYIARLEYYDYVDLARTISRDLIEHFVKSSPTNIDERVKEIEKACEYASFLGTVCSTCHMIQKLSMILPRRDKNLFKKIIRTFNEMFSRVFSLNERALGQIHSRMVEKLFYDSTILVMSHTHMMARIIGGLRYKIKKVYVSKKYPLNSGITIARELRDLGVDVVYVPDEYLAWAVEQSDLVLGFSLGTTSAGKIITESGMQAAISMANLAGTNVMIIAPVSFMCAINDEVLKKRVPGFVISNDVTGIRVKLRSIDVIDPEISKHMIVTETEVINSSREEIVKRQRQLEKIITDSITYILRKQGIIIGR